MDKRMKGKELSLKEVLQKQTETVETHRCTGHCCKMFWFATGEHFYRPKDLKIRMNRALANSNNPKLAEIRRKAEYNMYLEFRQIVLMVKWLGDFPEIPKGLLKKSTVISVAKGEKISLYTCRNLDKDGSCTIYDKRPDICRRYPSGFECGYAGCTRKTKRVPVK